MPGELSRLLNMGLYIFESSGAVHCLRLTPRLDGPQVPPRIAIPFLIKL